VALVDADFACPQVARQLAISIRHGWETALAGDKSLWEVMIESIADRFSLLPLADPAPGDDLAPPVYRMAASLNELADNFDVVLVDAGPLCAESATPQWLLEPAVGVQGVVLAHNVAQTEAGRLATVCLQLAEARQRQIGIAEMFGREHSAVGGGQWY
jgi:MinD-like ATPase involved in chromosome partitioning or flagellar assembly